MEKSSYFVSSKRLVLTSRVSESEAKSQYLKKNRAERSVKGYVSPSLLPFTASATPSPRGSAPKTPLMPHGLYLSTKC